MKIKILALFIACVTMSTGAFAQIDRSQQPEPGPAPTINLGEPETFSLDNGLKVLVVENHKLPRVSASLIIDNKPHAEADKPATSSLVSALLGTGTENTSKDEFNEEIDFLGANIGYGSESAYASGLSKFFPRILELMAEGALMPKFTQEEFEAEKNKLLEGIKSSEKDVASTAGTVSAALAYGKNHPYGEFPTVENTEMVTLEDVQNFYDQYFVPANAYLVVVGDIKSDEVEDLVRKNFGSWKAQTPPDQELPAVTDVEETQINFVDMPNAVQSELRLQNIIDLEMADEDYFPVLVANQILGGSFGSYLNMNLREEHGYTYGAGSSAGADKYAARFVAQASVRNAVTDSAIVETLKEIDRIKTELVDEQMLEDTKSKFAGTFVLRLEQPSTIANYALNIETQDLPKDFYQTYLKRINDVTPEDIQRVANKYFNSDKMRIVVVGKGSEVMENLENINYNGKQVPVKYFDKYANEAEKPDYNKEIDPNLTAEMVLNNYLEAIGGREAAEAVTAVHVIGEADVQGNKLNLEIKATSEGQMFDQLTAAGQVALKQAFTGETGYIEMGGQKMPFSEDQKASALIMAKPFPELEASNATLEGIEVVGEEDAYVLAMSGDTKSYYSTETGLKLQTVQTLNLGPQSVSFPILYGDYQEVEGIKFPFVITRSMGPQSFTFQVSEVTLNEEVDATEFE